MSTAILSRKPSVSTSRAAVRRLLAQWQSLHSRQRSILDELASVEDRLSRHLDLAQAVCIDGIAGSYSDLVLDVDSEPDVSAEWLTLALDAAGI